MNIADVTFLIARIFSGGPAPVCGPIPTLIDSGLVLPPAGVVAEMYTYQVRYKDIVGSSPMLAQVLIDGSFYSMTQVSGGSDTSAIFQYQTTLPIGQNTYAFRFVTALGDTLRYPELGSMIGPQVTTDNSTIISGQTVVMDSLSQLTLTQNADTVLTYIVSGEPPSLSAGDVLIGFDSIGYLKKVDSTQYDNSTFRVYVSDATLSEAIENGIVDTLIQLTIPSPNQKRAPGQWEIYQAPGVSVSQGVISLDGFSIFSGNVGGAIVNLSIPTGSIQFDPSIDLKIKLKNHSVERFRAVASGQLSLDCNLQLVTSGAFSKNTEKTIYSARTVQ